ncbi:MAG: TetR/AcrR family transcriptional regulator [Microbacteriaceae bacterium]
MTTSEMGLRDRKRQATKRAIQRAVLTLAAERGYDNVTVEEISREADIAPRTFFNYFATKDAALIPELPQAPDDESLRRFVDGEPSGDLWRDFGEFVAEQFASFDGDREILQLRHRLFRDSPHLSKLHFSNLRDFEERLTLPMTLRVEADAKRRGTGVEDGDLYLMRGLASGALRTAWMNWAKSDDHVSLPDRIRQVFERVPQAVATYR